MKLKFDSNLDFQRDAIDSVVDLFEGLPAQQSSFEVSLGQDAFMGTQQNELGIGNAMPLGTDAILKNIQAIQERNFIPKSSKLIQPGDEYSFPNYSVEMETGTGKTYVYLRSIFELNRKYGLKKFIIVVPSVAIREGVLTSIRLMKEHFRRLYDNVPFDHFDYKSKDVTKLRQFAVNNEIQIMIINIQAFQKDAGNIEDYSKLTSEEIKKLNIIHREDDRSSGYRWIEYVRKMRPIVIIDEPQSVDTTPKAKRAIKTLDPLFALRYSATHSNSYNLLYKLDPIRAYDLRLVKQIEVWSRKDAENFNETFIRLDKVYYPGKQKKPIAKATVHEDTINGPREKSITLKQRTDVADQTNRAGYDGYIVENINAEPDMEHVEFGNGVVLELGTEKGGMAEDYLKSQLEQTVEEHFKKVLKFKKQGKDIKVLSLFFVDAVKNYREYDDDGNPQKGKFAKWFENAFDELSKKPMFKDLLPFTAEEVHDGYFSVDKKRGKIVGLKDTKGTTKADEETYELIMRDKERLLNSDEPLRFIFSHSALKEGWDNPNVFQICTLREMGTDRQRRQTIGRGLRLPVDSEGNRIFDDSVNRLTVVANESFEDYARGLQNDIEGDLGADFKFGRIPEIAFAQLVDVEAETESPLGQEKSAEIVSVLKENGYLDELGDLTAKFTPDEKGFVLELPEALESLREAIVVEMKRYEFKGRIVNARERKKLTYNKRVSLNEDFKKLWGKIGKKTRYRVEFETETLIQKAVTKIKDMEKIDPVIIELEKSAVGITVGGVEQELVREVDTYKAEPVKFLPDILTFLQRETELTRGTLVEILKRSERLGEFKINPQAFMTAVAKLLRRSLNELIVDGIKYEKLENQRYEMRLFEEQEIETYLSRLYEVQSKDDRTPYDYVLIDNDSSIERNIAEKLDTNEAVKFFCKLPDWFKIPTPVGTYNPDWAIVKQDDSKLYLVKESKSTHIAHQRRDNENRKIKCGKAHFDALGVEFGVATNIHEILNKEK